MDLNKKGFTLIELLAVIVILAIIALIATPIILNIISDVREKSILESGNNYINSINLEIVNKLQKNEIIEDGNYIIDSNYNLIYNNTTIKPKIKGTNPLSGYVIIKNNIVQSAEIAIDDYKIIYKDKKYELTNKTLYVGIDQITVPNFGKLEDFKIYGNSVQNNLPAGYTRCEYLESTGTQWIEIYSINEKDTYELGSKINFVIRNSRQAFGNVQANYFEINSSGYYGMGGGVVSTVKASIDFDNIKIKIMSDKSQIIVDNNVIAERLSIVMGSYNKIYLFAVEPNTFPYLNCKMRNKTTILKHNNSVVRNLIPCLDNNNEPCMYDTVSKTSFYNQGTGEFKYKVQTFDEIPTLENPIKIESVGDLITDTENINYDKYKIPIKVNDSISNIYLNDQLRKVGDYADYIDFKNKRVIRWIGKIESYNREEIKGEYISTTGSLDIGSTIYYILEQPIFEKIELPKIELLNEKNIIEVEGASKLELFI